MGSSNARQKRVVVLKRSADFAKLREFGRAVTASPWLRIQYLSQNYGHCRCGWTISRKVGSAVIRNKLKRWCREFLRYSDFKNELEVDINFIFRSQNKGFYSRLDYGTFCRTLERGLQKMGHLGRIDKTSSQNLKQQSARDSNSSV